MNHTIFSTALPSELPNCTKLDSLEQTIMTPLTLVYSNSSGLVWILSSIMWAVTQHKIVLYLTAPFADIQWNFETKRYEPRTRELASLSLSDGGRDIFLYASCCLLYLVMYSDFVNCGIPLGSPPPLQAIIICLIPITLPHRFYVEWPVLSKGFLLSWAQIWLQSLSMAVAGMVVPFPS